MFRGQNRPLSLPDMLARGLIRLCRPLPFVQTQPLHLLVERGPVDAQHLGRGEAIPLVAFQHVQDDLPLGAGQCVFQAASAARIGRGRRRRLRPAAAGPPAGCGRSCRAARPARSRFAFRGRCRANCNGVSAAEASSVKPTTFLPDSRQTSSRKCMCQQRDVRDPLANRRQLDIDYVDPIVQVLPEAPFGHQLAQVFVRGQDHSCVDVQGLVAADRLELPVPATRAVA